jgi:bifunctional non-homologous end joining protein LigD
MRMPCYGASIVPKARRTAAQPAALQSYSAKRSFAETPEPGPIAAPPRRGPLLFVVQKHAARRLHYDLRLELDGVLKSWAVPKGPSLDPAAKRLAVAVEDHPFDYASFEGVIPARQYGAGNVIVWDCGAYSPDEAQQYAFDRRDAAEQRVRAELEAGKLSFFLRGVKLKGSFALVRTRNTDEWLLIKHADRFASRSEVLELAGSVLCDRTVEDIGTAPAPSRLAAAQLAPDGELERMPRTLAPMLAESGERLRTDPQWRYEPKLDGYRVIAHLQGGKVRLLSRRGLELSHAFPEIVAELQAQAVEQMILDAEIVALGADGRPTFNALQNRAQLKAAADIERARQTLPVVLVCFDLLHFAGVNLRPAPYADRRRYLAQCLLPSAHLQLVHADTDAERLYQAALDSGFEGVIAKRIDCPYLAGRRSPAWRKYKSTRTIELVIGGYTAGKAARASLGALLLGYWDGDQLRYAGHVGSGLTDESIGQLRARLVPLKRARSPFSQAPPLHRPTSWTEPALVAEVSYLEWTPEGLLRAPVFVRLRDDIDPRTVRAGPDAAPAPSANKRPVARRTAQAATPANEIEQVLQQLRRPGQRLDLAVAGTRLRLTHLDRQYWPADPQTATPAISKRDLIAYLAAVSPHMLPHLKDRPLTMIRMPEGIGGERFFQKHWEQSLPEFVQTVPIYSGHRDEQQRYLLANNLSTLLWLAQSGTLEFHIWHSHLAVAGDTVRQGTDYASSLEALERSALNYPDYLVFDIDPYIYSGLEAPGAEPELNRRGFAGGKQVAFWLHELLGEMSLRAFVKTSGKTGLHVFVPIERSVTFDAAREICESIGRHLLRQHPKEITMEWAVQKRTGKIFIDYNMNVRGKTLNVAYSPRGVAGAPVSMPLSWEELQSAEPQHFHITNAMQRLEKTGDRWHDLPTSKQDLARAFDAAKRR